MPVYEYHCPNCNKVHELWRSMYETEECSCPECSVQMQKLVSRSSFQLKGSGWYADGYCKKKDEKSADSRTADSKVCSKAENNEKPVCSTCS